MKREVLRPKNDAQDVSQIESLNTERLVQKIEAATTDLWSSGLEIRLQGRLARLCFASSSTKDGTEGVGWSLEDGKQAPRASRMDGFGLQSWILSVVGTCFFDDC